MKEKIKQLAEKYREFIRYAIVGVLTTAINLGVFYVLAHIGSSDDELHTILFNSIAWAASVVFSYFASRRFVFQSNAETPRQRLGEFSGFALSRGLTLILEDVLLYVMVASGIDSKIAKIPVCVIVVIVNYITGHLVFHGARKTWQRFLGLFSREKK